MSGIRTALQAWARYTLTAVKTKLSKIPDGTFYHGFGRISKSDAALPKQIKIEPPPPPAQTSPTTKPLVVDGTNRFIPMYGWTNPKSKRLTLTEVLGLGTAITAVGGGLALLHKNEKSKTAEAPKPAAAAVPHPPGNIPSGK
jgi:hypothetical protein